MPNTYHRAAYHAEDGLRCSKLMFGHLGLDVYRVRLWIDRWWFCFSRCVSEQVESNRERKEDCSL